MSAPWWRSAVVYHAYLRSFADASGDGIGDLEGLRQHLDHLTWLGVDAICLAPIYPSPMADFGHDVANYTDIDPVFGSLDEFDHLLKEAHDRGLRVLLDWVPNHTSDRHPWFMASRGSMHNPYRDWYCWSDRPNNWRQVFSTDPAWTLDPRTGQYYLHHFLPQQPDLNWAKPAVRSAMYETLQFWLERGVDGFRADAIQLIGRDPELADTPPNRGGIRDHYDRRTHEWLREIRGVLDRYADRVMIGTVDAHDPTRSASYVGPDQLHLALDVGILHAPWDAEAFGSLISGTERAMQPDDRWPAWAFSNHDLPRHRSRYGGSEPRARVAATLLLTLRGTPFLYAGEELGLQDTDVPEQRRVDHGGRDGCRAPLPWDGSATHGWTSQEPWLPWPPEADTRNVADQRRDPGSIANLYRRLLRARRSSAALRLGGLTMVEAHASLVAYERTLNQERWRVVANFADTAVQIEGAGRWRVAVSSTGERERQVFDGGLCGEEAVLLAPA